MVTLVILDGFGWNKKRYGNAIMASKIPYIKKLIKKFPFTLLSASGSDVGLEKGQMGGSEVGHLNIGAGRIVWQDLTEINKQIENDTLKDSPAVIKAFSHAKRNNSKLHLLGLLSSGGVHSNIQHLKYLIKKANEYGIKDICIHAILDGRDTLKNSGEKFIKEIEDFSKDKNAKICSIIGRVYAMDREKRFDRIQKAYDMLVLGRADNYYQDTKTAISESYDAKVFDEFVLPTIVGKIEKIESGDSIIFFNFRADRARELTSAITLQTPMTFPTVKLNDLCFVTMTNYSDDFKDIDYIIKPKRVEENLAKIISQNGKKQFHISETTKYAHVTFFLNGGIEKPYKNEDRQLIESFDVKDFSLYPQMKAFEITQSVLEAISSEKYDFIVVNLSNADMIGHTGNFDATVQSVKIVDKCAYSIALATLMANGHCLICADHGNADYMLDKKGNIVTSHSMSPVPCILVSDKYKNVKLKKNLSLTSIAPTVLKLLEIDVPKFMDTPLFD